MTDEGRVSLLLGEREDPYELRESLPEYVVESLGDASNLSAPDSGAPWAIVLGHTKQEQSTGALDLAVANLDYGATLFVVVDEERTGELLPAIRSGKDIRYFAPSETPQLVDELRRFMRNGQPPPFKTERRAFPRVHVQGAVVIEPPGVALNDISTGGVSFIAPGSSEVGEEIDLVVRLSASKPALRLRAKVLRDENFDLGRRRVAAKFVDPKPRVVHILRGAVLAGVAANGLRDLQERVREDGDPDGPRLAEPERVRAFLERLAEHECECLFSGPLRSEPFSTRILDVDAAGTLRFSAPPSGAALREGDRLDSTVGFEYESYLFSVVVSAADVDSLTCTSPDVVYLSEKRTHRRHSIPRAANVYFEFDLSYPAGTVRWPVVNFGSGGLCVEAPGGSAMFLEGARIQGARVVVGGRVAFGTSAEICHATVVGDKGVRVGMRFVADQNAAHATHQRATEFVTVDDGSLSAAKVVRFANRDGEEIVGLYDSSHQGDDKVLATTVIIPPAWGRTKESFSTFAAAIVETFRNAGQPVAVLRLDYTHCRGESYVPKENRSSGREALDFLCSRAANDLRSAIDWVHDNPLFFPERVVLLGPSFSAPMALQVASQDQRISLLVCPMGAPDMQDLMKNCTGGLDYLGSARKGVHAGVVNLLGLLVDMTSVADDLLHSGIAFIEQARRAIEDMQNAIVWIYGEHDAWINPDRVKALLNAKRRGERQLVQLSTGHLATSVAGDDTLLIAAEVVRAVIDHVSLDTNIKIPSAAKLEKLSRAEWQRAPTVTLDDSRGYWGDYLLGTRKGATAFDVIKETTAYRELMATQTQLLELFPGQRVLDAGCGTGNFLDLVLSEGSAGALRGGTVTLVDFVPGALGRAREKVERNASSQNIATEFAAVNLEASRLRPIEEFVRGELPGFASLRGRVPGLSDELVLEIVDAYDATLHAGLRGNPDELSRALPRLSPAAAAVARDVSRAARVIRAALLPEDARAGREAVVDELNSSSRVSNVRPSDVDFEALDFGDTPLSESLDLGCERYDRILSSLVLPYVVSPEYTLAAFHRALRDGGIAVVSTMRPDADISKIYADFVHRVERGEYTPPPGVSAETVLDDLREYANSAAFLLRLAEEGTFRFYSAQEWCDLLRRAGFRDVKVRTSFGDPGQAYVAVGRK